MSAETTEYTPNTGEERVDRTETLENLMAYPAPARPTAVRSVALLGGRALSHLRREPVQLIDVTIFPVLMMVMFTYLLGGAISGSTDAYLSFLLPGMMVMSVVLCTAAGGVRLNTDIERGVFDRLRTLVGWRPAPLVGSLVGDVARYTLAASSVLGAGLVLGFRPQGGVGGTVAAVALLVLFAVCLTWVWLLVGLVARSAASVTAASTLLFPLAFLGDVFVPAQTLPGWLRVVVEVNPVAHLARAVRDLMAGAGVTSSVVWTLVCALVLVVVFVPWTLAVYRRR
ncbi:ABC transporter permease [Nocardiopsis sp. NPDC007018]|uniref:ABC transporter permease n=1 Tax=Nocardiopsis sp. NPDC007018 TaxID=3155721 RepID=UPI0034107BEF